MTPTAEQKVEALFTPLVWVSHDEPRTVSVDWADSFQYSHDPATAEDDIQNDGGAGEWLDQLFGGPDDRLSSGDRLRALADYIDGGRRAVVDEVLATGDAFGRSTAARTPLAHCTAIAAAAGLEVVGDLLAVLVNRETVPDAALLALTVDDMREFYERFVAPAVNDMEEVLNG